MSINVVNQKTDKQWSELVYRLSGVTMKMKQTPYDKSFTRRSNRKYTKYTGTSSNTEKDK